LLIFPILFDRNCVWIEKKSELNVGTFKAILPVKTNTELSHEEFNEKLVANPGALKELCDTGKYCATATNSS
jgi:hypothetical protein